ncbi:hypothetical protein [Leptospira levettii]|uniref:hypothetical protein n=1 Tax=Leptospira levettii TaxID=2023178 RepID=UPI0014385E10|nr:hypothetical protein [Leptospira levettii]
MVTKKINSRNVFWANGIFKEVSLILIQIKIKTIVRLAIQFFKTQHQSKVRIGVKQISLSFIKLTDGGSFKLYLFPHAKRKHIKF